MFHLASLKLTGSLPLKIGRGPKGNYSSISSIHFQVRTVSFREGIRFHNPVFVFSAAKVLNQKGTKRPRRSGQQVNMVNIVTTNQKDTLKLC